MDEKMIKVSVIMPVLNGMPYFPKALESVMNQLLQELEIYVVDAGSEDGTIEYVTKMMEKDQRICLLHSDKKSMGHQYNLGIAQAQGEYIGFCESDDYIEKEMFLDLYQTALKYNYPDTIKAGFYMFFESEGKEKSFIYNSLPKNLDYLYGKIINLSSVPDIYGRDTNMWNGIYHKKFLLDNEILFQETPGAAFQDHSFIKQVDFLAKRQIYVREAYYHYRRDNDFSTVYKKDSALYVIHEWEYIMQFLNQHDDVKQKYADLALATFMNFLTEQYGRNSYFYSTLDYEKEIDELQRKVICFYNSLSYPIKSKAGNIRMFLNSVDTYKAVTKTWYRGFINAILDLKAYLSGQKQVVILGAGELGQSVCAFLIKNHYTGDIAFGDNDIAKQGKVFMDKMVYSVEVCAAQFPEECFIIPGGSAYYAKMCLQLINLGICWNQIISFPTEIGPHPSMETSWDFNEKDE